MAVGFYYRNGAKTVEAALSVAYAASAARPGEILAAASAAALASATTPKNVLGVQLTFTDNANVPYTTADFLANLNAASSRISAMSYGKTSLINTVPDVGVPMAHPAAYYAGGLKQTEMNADARSFLDQNGYNTAQYDFIVYACPAVSNKGPNAVLGGRDMNIYTNTTKSVLYHEFGHNYGLNHANFWVGALASGDFVDHSGVNTDYGPAENDEYGDSFDVMAVDFRQAPGSDPVEANGDYAMSEKAYLNRIDATEVTTATTTGTYRVYRFDHQAAAAQTANKLALNFHTGVGESLWVGLRRKFPNNPLLSTGAYLVWAHRNNQHEQIDCTPMSRIDPDGSQPAYDLGDLDREDSALPAGMSWTSPDGSVRLTNLGIGGTAPYEYMDVKLEFLSAAPPPAFGLYINAQATTPGLTGSYYNGLPPINQPDWTATQTRSGVRVDNPVDFPNPGWGTRSTVGVTGGTDAAWDNFAVQWDGYCKVNAGKVVQLASRNDDGSRFWLDLNGNGTFDASEEVTSNWGYISGNATGNYSRMALPGTYKMRVQYYDLGLVANPTETPPSFQFLSELIGNGDFDLYQDQALTTYGLTSKYVNSSLRAVSSQADWTGTQTISGTRADPMPLYWDNSMGPRAGTGVTGGSDGDWQSFSVQHDGWIKVIKRTRFLTFGCDGTRFWIDTNGNGTFGTTAPEYHAGNWGQNGSSRFGPFSGWVDPGTYRIRIQHEQDADGGNRWGFFGQNSRQTSAGQGINVAGAGLVNAPAGTGISGSFTVEAWARPASPTATLTILSTRNDFGFDMKFQDGNLIHGDIGTASSWLTTTANAAFNYRAGEWYHIAYCVGGGSYEIYVNGFKRASKK